jgi:hypothetical protein
MEHGAHLIGTAVTLDIAPQDRYRTRMDSSHLQITIRSKFASAAEMPAVVAVSDPYASYWFSFTYYLPPALLVGQEAPMS